MGGDGKPIRVLYVYGAADRTGESRIEAIRTGLTRAGFRVDTHEFYVIDWGRFAVNPRDHDRRALLDNRFGANDQAARALLRAVMTSSVPRIPVIGSLVRWLVGRFELLTPYRSVAAGSYPVLLDVFAYMRNTEEIVGPTVTRLEYLVSTSKRPVVAIGLSLGGIILVDALSRWIRNSAPEERAQLKLFTTVGSQSPMLHACDALLELRRDGESATTPFVPWLNIWRRLDLLSFPARPMFAAQFPDETDLRDVALDPGPDPEAFPDAHSSYFDDANVYAAIATMLADLGTAYPGLDDAEAPGALEGLQAAPFEIEADDNAMVAPI